MKRILSAICIVLTIWLPAFAGETLFATGAGGASWGDAPDSLGALGLAKTGDEDGAAVYQSSTNGGEFDGLPIIRREYAFKDGKLGRVTLYFNVWHVDEALKLAKNRLGDPVEENALMARFENEAVVLILFKKKAALAVFPKNAEACPIPGDTPSPLTEPGETGEAQTKAEAKPEAKPKPAKDPELLSQTKILAYSLNIMLDKMDCLEKDSAENRISFNSYSDAYAKLAKESESLTSRYPKADGKLLEFAVVLNSLVSDLTFLTQKILSIQNDASLSGSLLNSAVSGATGNYLGVVNSITGYFGSSKNEEKIKNDVIALRKRFAATREEYAKKLKSTREHVKAEYGIEF
jgi:hypothetical protein